MANISTATYTRIADAENTDVTMKSPQYQHIRRRTPLTQPDKALNFEINLASIADNDGCSSLKPKMRPPLTHRSRFWSRKSTLFSVMILCKILLLSLLFLWQYARANHGFSITFTANHLAWTYAPTAVIVLFVGIWRQIDSHFKAAQAWKVMKNGFAPAPETVLLDYTFPLQIQSFVQALKYRHFAVAGSIGAFSILKLIQFVSTGLLVSSEVLVPSTTPVQVSTVFNGTAFWLTQPPTNPLDVPPYILDPWGITFPNISRNSFYAYMADVQNDPLSFNDNASLTAFPDISLSTTGNTNLTSITADLNIFVPKITCEVADVKPVPPRKDSFQWSVNISSPTCPSFQNNEDESEAGTSAAVTFSYVTDDLFSNSTVTKPIFFQKRINCSMAESFDNYTEFADFDRTGFFDYRFALFVVNVTTAQHMDSDTDFSNLQLTNVIHNTTGVICKVDYDMNSASVTLNLQNQSYSLATEKSETYLGPDDTLTASELLEILLSITTKGYNENVAADFDGNVMFQAIQSVLGNGSSPVDFFDGHELRYASQTALSGIAAQFVKESFYFPSNEVIDGIGEQTQTRIRVSQVSLWIMVGGISIVSLLTLILAITDPRSVGNELKSETVAGHATVLASSSNLKELLCSMHSIQQAALETALKPTNFRLRNSGGQLEIEPSTKVILDLREKEAANLKNGEEFWKPYACQWHAIALVMLLPSVSIAALEYMFQISTQHKGLFTVAGNDSTQAYAIRYITTVIAFIIATLFNSLDFTVAIITPFSAMGTRSVSAARSLLTNLLRPLPPLELYSAIRQRHWGPSLSSTAGLIGAFLSVVVPGLWVLQSSAEAHSVQASLSTYWNVTWHNSSQSDSGAAATFNAIQHGSEKLAPNIWNDLVIPGITDVEPASNDTLNLWDYARAGPASNHTFTVPVLRPKLNCTKMPAENMYTYYIPPDARSPPRFMVSTWMDLPPQCVQWANANYTFVNITTELSTLNGTQYFGSLHDVHITSQIDDGHYMNYVTGEAGAIYPLPDNPAGCPSLSIQFGYTKGQGYGFAPLLPKLTTMLCYQQMEQVNATVNFIGNPSYMVLDPQHPPQTDETTARLLTNGTLDIDSFPYRIEAHITQNFDEFNTPNGDAGSTPWGLDQFFKVMVGGPNNISLTALDDDQVFMAAIEKMYKAYMVNVINLNMKVSAMYGGSTPNATEAKVEGVMHAVVKRLGIDPTSKVILQTMLGIMALCAALTYLLVDMRGVLPHNPCSIVGTMSLLAGSKICERGFLPDGAQNMNDKQLGEVLAGHEYGLGWWHNEHEVADKSKNATSDTIHIRKRMRRFGVDVGIPDEYAVRNHRLFSRQRRS